MTTLTIKSTTSGKTTTKFFSSLDELKKALLGVSHNKSLSETKIIKFGKEEYEIVGVTYDQDDESISLLQKYNVIPKNSDYPDGYEVH